MSAALHLHCLDTLTSPARQPGSQRTLALKATLSSTEVKGPSQISLSWPATCSSPLGPHAGMRGTWKSFSPSHFYLLLVLKHQPSALPRRRRRTLPDHMLGWGQHPAPAPRNYHSPLSFCLLQDFELSHFCFTGLQQQIHHRWSMLEPKPERGPESSTQHRPNLWLLSSSSAGPGPSMATCISE